MYADTITGSMNAAITETNRRREIQNKYNEDHGITPTTIKKKVGDLIQIGTAAKGGRGEKKKESREEEITRLRAEMKAAAAELRFEEAAFLRDKIRTLETTKDTDTPPKAPKKPPARRKR